MYGLTLLRDSSAPSRRPVPAPNPNSWATVDSITGSSYQLSTVVPMIGNDSSLQIQSSVHDAKTIETKDHSGANNTPEDSISEPAPRTPEVCANSSTVSPPPPSLLPQQQQRNHSLVPPIKMSWHRSAISKTPPPVRLGRSRAQSVQGNLTVNPHPQVLTERPKSVQAASCTRCLTPFSSTNEEYQCPNCKRFFDSKCSSKKAAIWWLEIFEPVRVDDECFATITGEIPQGKHLHSRRS